MFGMDKALLQRNLPKLQVTVLISPCIVPWRAGGVRLLPYADIVVYIKPKVIPCSKLIGRIHHGSLMKVVEGKSRTQNILH